jgi:hypothetical protein
VVSVVAQHNLAKPGADRGRTMMLAALKLDLDGLEPRCHSLLRRDPPDGESSIGLALPTEVGETQERKSLWFSLSGLFPVSSGKPPELDQPCLVRMEVQTKLRQPSPKFLQEPLGIRSVLKTKYKVSGPGSCTPRPSQNCT